MRIAVCMKAVVDSQARIELDGDGNLRQDQLRFEVNEYDLYAVEEAIRLAESDEGHVTVISAGTADAVQGLRKGLAMGAADAIHVDCDPDDLDASGVAAVLAAALHDGGYDLVLAGVESDDLGGSQVGVLLAEALGYASTTLVVGTNEPVDGAMQVRRELEGGEHANVQVQFPAVLTIQSGINEPRYPSLKGIMAAKRKDLAVKGLADLGFDGAPARRVESLGLTIPPPRELARMLEGGAEETAAELVRILREEEKAL
ncbi:MAG: electron transfer flavoprotein subunit beta [Acidobacteria bacterium]|nr:electron transfer flavoprotein subunit beta [Acidobacteriota bacterium]